MNNDTEAKKTDAKAANAYGFSLIRESERFTRNDVIFAFYSGAAYVRQELRDAKIAAARRGAELARDDVYRIKEPTLETGGLSEVEYKHSIDEVLDVYTKELDGDE